jgi:hypothetical protein
LLGERVGDVTASLGVWASGPVTGGTLYRWEADRAEDGNGFVVFDAQAQTIRPSDADGNPQGTLIVDVAAAQSSGETEGVSRSLVLKVAASIHKAYRRAGKIPETAHAYYY